LQIMISLKKDGVRFRQDSGGRAAASGGNYQVRVAAWLGVRILLGRKAAPLWGLPSSVTLERLECQSGQPVDDLLATTSTGGSALLQVKRRVRLEKSPTSDLGTTISQFVAQHLRGETSLDPTRDRLVLITGPDSSDGIRRILPQLLERIRASADVVPLERVPRTAEEIDLFRVLWRHIESGWLRWSPLKERPRDIEISGLLQLCYVQVLDMGPCSSGEREALDALRQITGNSRDGDAAWAHLLDYFALAHEAGMGADRERLAQQLGGRYEIPLASDPDQVSGRFLSETRHLLAALGDLEIGDIQFLGELVGIRRAELGQGNILELAVALVERARIAGRLGDLSLELRRIYPALAARYDSS
jgi:hypothetical protein